MARDLAEAVDFGRYEPIFRIGVGGMAEVYAARIRGEAGFQKLVAVKRMLPHLSGDQRFVDMFLDEARLAANITSPHVVQTLDLGRADDDSLYIVMELILGVTISEMMRYLAGLQHQIDLGAAVELVAQAAQGLDDAHEATAPGGEPLHLVHRDISPQNILVGIDGRARVTDFGIAHALLLRRTETQVGEMKGKFAYFSPEQALGHRIDRRSDIFALGVVAWEVFTQRRLFAGTPTDQIAAVKRCEIVAPHELRPEISAPLSDAIMGALTRNPDDRYPSAAVFSSALKRAGNLLGELPTPRALGQFVGEVGGDRLSRMQQCIAQSNALPNDIAHVTAIIEGTVSDAPEGTELLSDPERAESTRVLDDVDLLPHDAPHAMPDTTPARPPVARGSDIHQESTFALSAGAAELPIDALADTLAQRDPMAHAPTTKWRPAIAAQPQSRTPMMLAFGGVVVVAVALAAVVFALTTGGATGAAPVELSPTASPSTGGEPGAGHIETPAVEPTNDLVEVDTTRVQEVETAVVGESEPEIASTTTTAPTMAESRQVHVRTRGTRTMRATSMTTPATMDPALESTMESSNPLPMWRPNH